MAANVEADDVGMHLCVEGLALRGELASLELQLLLLQREPIGGELASAIITEYCFIRTL